MASNQSIDPVVILMAGISLANYIAKLMDPNYVPPTTAQLVEALSKLKSESDLELYEPPSAVKKFFKDLLS